MLSRNQAPAGDASRSRLDAAIIASVLAMGALDALMPAKRVDASKAYAAAPCPCGTVAGLALA
jgi:hypothetical protein